MLPTSDIHGIVLLMVLHFIADWALQTNWMALNKSKNWWALCWHVSVYSLCFLPFFGLTFGGITWLTHFLTDAITSRVTSKLWYMEPLVTMEEQNEFLVRYNPRKRKWFFVTIGFDQLVHFLTLTLTLISLF